MLNSVDSDAFNADTQSKAAFQEAIVISVPSVELSEQVVNIWATAYTSRRDATAARISFDLVIYSTSSINASGLLTQLVDELTAAVSTNTLASALANTVPANSSLSAATVNTNASMKLIETFTIFTTSPDSVTISEECIGLHQVLGNIGVMTDTVHSRLTKVVAQIPFAANLGPTESKHVAETVVHTLHGNWTSIQLNLSSVIDFAKQVRANLTNGTLTNAQLAREADVRHAFIGCIFSLNGNLSNFTFRASQLGLDISDTTSVRGILQQHNSVSVGPNENFVTHRAGTTAGEISQSVGYHWASLGPNSFTYQDRQITMESAALQSDLVIKVTENGTIRSVTVPYLSSYLLGGLRILNHGSTSVSIADIAPAASALLVITDTHSSESDSLFVNPFMLAAIGGGLLLLIGFGIIWFKYNVEIEGKKENDPNVAVWRFQSEDSSAVDPEVADTFFSQVEEKVVCGAPSSPDADGADSDSRDLEAYQTPSVDSPLWVDRITPIVFNIQNCKDTNEKTDCGVVPRLKLPSRDEPDSESSELDAYQSTSVDSPLWVDRITPIVFDRQNCQDNVGARLKLRLRGRKGFLSPRKSDLISTEREKTQDTAPLQIVHGVKPQLIIEIMQKHAQLCELQHILLALPRNERKANNLVSPRGVRIRSHIEKVELEILELSQMRKAAMKHCPDTPASPRGAPAESDAIFEVIIRDKFDDDAVSENWLDESSDNALDYEDESDDDENWTRTKTVSSAVLDLSNNLFQGTAPAPVVKQKKRSGKRPYQLANREQEEEHTQRAARSSAASQSGALEDLPGASAPEERGPGNFARW